MAASGWTSGDRAARWFDNAKTIVIAVLIALGVRVGIAQAYEVEGPSMEPSLVSGQRLFVLRAAYGLTLPGADRTVALWSLPDVGDVVIIESPVDSLDLVKRVVGVPGDVIAVHDNVLWRNGTAVTHADLGACDPARHTSFDPRCHVIEETIGDREWRTSRDAGEGGYGADMAPVTVPQGHVFIMGDHRDRSNDSRAFGPVPVTLLRGRVLFVD
jgi:signal peptidase I